MWTGASEPRVGRVRAQGLGIRSVRTNSPVTRDQGKVSVRGEGNLGAHGKQCFANNMGKVPGSRESWAKVRNVSVQYPEGNWSMAVNNTANRESNVRGPIGAGGGGVCPRGPPGA